MQVPYKHASPGTALSTRAAITFSRLYDHDDTDEITTHAYLFPFAISSAALDRIVSIALHSLEKQHIITRIYFCFLQRCFQPQCYHRIAFHEDTEHRRTHLISLSRAASNRIGFFIALHVSETQNSHACINAQIPCFASLLACAAFCYIVFILLFGCTLEKEYTVHGLFVIV
jgi:hypothetical protein